jgi:hypothetical protein
MKIDTEIRPAEAVKIPIYKARLKDIRNVTGNNETCLKKGLSEWEKEISTRRVNQLAENQEWLTSLIGTEVRKGYQLTLLQMGIPESECPVIEETETKITWHAYDFCPYLEAINELGMDTKIVCKYLTESPVQTLLNVLNPNLHFSRNYDKIRPCSEYCEETIELINNC